MKKVINNKMYNTETAKAVGNYSNTPYHSDFNYCSETLYRKRTGEFFLYGEGGPNSQYCQVIGNNEWGYGSDIIPISEEQAKQWAEAHLSGDEYEAIFGPIEE